jgi:arginine N-succinyltransferase
MFMRLHRARFADKVIAELRGVIDEAGASPFWDAVAGRFFGMSFQDADEFNAVHGTQFIADLMPKTPIYTAMLPESARQIMGVPHPSGRAAMRMLEREGFSYECYVDIFDGGPTMVAKTDEVRTVREARELTIGAVGEAEGAQQMLLAAGRLSGFAACYGSVGSNADGTVTLEAKAAELLGLGVGDSLIGMPR